MLLEDIDTSSSYKLSRLLNTLQKNHNVILDFSVLESKNSLKELKEYVDSNKNDPATILIAESVKIYLNEIAHSVSKNTQGA